MLFEILCPADPECKKRNKGFSANAPGRSGFCLSSAKAAGKKSGRRSRDEAFVSHGTAFTACHAAYHDSGIFIVFSFLTSSDICMVVCIRKCLKYRACCSIQCRCRKRLPQALGCAKAHSLSLHRFSDRRNKCFYNLKNNANTTL